MDNLEYFSVKTIRESYNEYPEIQGTGTIIKSKGCFYMITALHCMGKVVEGREIVPFDWHAMSGRVYLPDEDVNIKVIGLKDLDYVKDWVILEIEAPNINFNYSCSSHLNSIVVNDTEYAAYGFPHDLESGLVLNFKPANKRGEEWLLQGVVQGEYAKANTIEKGSSGMGLYREENGKYICLGIINRSAPNGAFNAMKLIKAKEFAKHFSDINECPPVQSQEPIPAETTVKEAVSRINTSEKSDKQLCDEYIKHMALFEYADAKNCIVTIWNRHKGDEWATLNLINTVALVEPERLPQYADMGLSLEYTTRESVMFCAKAFGRNGYPDIASEIMYKNALLFNDETLDSMIYAETTLDGRYNPYFRKEYDVVTSGNCVLYGDNKGNRHCIMVTKDTVLGRSIIGCKKGQTVNVKLAGEARDITVLGIFDKYFLIHHRAMSETMESGGNQVLKPIKLEPDMKPEDLLKAIFDVAGIPDENPEDIRRNEYNQRPTLLNLLDDNDIIGWYYRLLFTDYELYGRPKSLEFQAKYAFINDQTELVIDLSSLLVLFELEQAGGIKPKKKFILSKCIYELLKEYRRDQTKHVSFCMHEVIKKGRIHKFDEDLGVDSAKRYDALIEWCDKYCLMESSQNAICTTSQEDNYIRMLFRHTMALFTNTSNRALLTEDWYLEIMLNYAVHVFSMKDFVNRSEFKQFYR